MCAMASVFILSEHKIFLKDFQVQILTFLTIKAFKRCQNIFQFVYYLNFCLIKTFLDVKKSHTIKARSRVVVGLEKP